MAIIANCNFEEESYDMGAVLSRNLIAQLKANLNSRLSPVQQSQARLNTAKSLMLNAEEALRNAESAYRQARTSLENAQRDHDNTVMSSRVI